MSEGLAEPPCTEQQQPMEMSRRQAVAGILSTGLIIAGGSVAEYLHPEFPKTGPVKASQKELPDDFYEPSTQTKLDIPTFKTKASLEDFMIDCYGIKNNQEVESLARSLLGDLATNLTIGYTEHMSDWLSYAQEIIIKSRGWRIPTVSIDARFTEPDVSLSQHSLARICRAFGAFPSEIMTSTQLREYALVGDLTLHAPGYNVKQNGIANVKDKLAVSALLSKTSGKPRTSIGLDALRRRCYAVDEDISNTTDTYNDLEYAKIVFGPNFTQEMLDAPQFYNTGIAKIAIPKVDRLVELFSGKLMLPDDKDFDESVHKQQELLLQRLISRYPGVPADYYKVLRNFRIKNGRTPFFYEELLAA